MSKHILFLLLNASRWIRPTPVLQFYSEKIPVICVFLFSFSIVLQNVFILCAFCLIFLLSEHLVFYVVYTSLKTYMHACRLL